MATKPNRQFGSLSKAARDRAARAGAQYGLTRRQVRERYNRGTYNPFARQDPLQRIPPEFRGEASLTPGGQIVVDWDALALTNMNAIFGEASPYGERIKWNEFTVMTNIANMPERVVRVMAMATEDEMYEFAYVRSRDENVRLPYGLTAADIFWQDENGSWRNAFWYH